ncbi:MAG: hypothetical protein KJ634_03655 [Gammaproteobacteria bacterium]|nr:hypothetical protein [Gammaproteobacteria bacterium]MBU1414700.1 hypothetical protein [Gammaproteobacteria bacterium]
MRNSPFTVQDASPLQKVLTFVVGGVLLVLGLMFSAVVVVAGIVIGLIVWGYLWWKTRELRRAMREAQSTAYSTTRTDGNIIEGEAVVVEEIRTTERVEGADENRKG